MVAAAWYLVVAAVGHKTGGDSLGMMDGHGRYLVGLDVGTSKIAAVAGEIRGDGTLDVVGLGVCDSRGVRRGVVADREATVTAIKRAINDAELIAGLEIASVYLGVSGAYIRGFNARGTAVVQGTDHVITTDDARRGVFAAAAAVDLPAGHEIVHVLPQAFVVDGQDGIRMPAGLTAATPLETSVHVITASATSMRDVVDCVEQAGATVVAIVAAPLAASEAILTQDEKELGVALVDIGAGTTGLAIFERGRLRHTTALAIGGAHFTNDLAVSLCVQLADAEALKRQCGCTLSTDNDGNTIEIPRVGGRRPRPMARRVLSEILRQRADELVRMVAAEIRGAGLDEALHAGVVLTGGGALIEGILEMTEQILDVPVRCGSPVISGSLADLVHSPTLATAVGLLPCAQRYRQAAAHRRVTTLSTLPTFGSNAG